MTLSTETTYQRFNGSGTTGPFTFTWPFMANADILVYYIDDPDEADPTDEVRVLLTEGDDYTLTGGSGLGGSITLDTALASGDDILVVRDTDLLQAADIRNQGNNFLPETHETALDKITMICQDLKRDVDLGPSFVAGEGLSAAQAAASALLAEAAKDDAETAQTAAEAAQGLAETAQAAAEAAITGGLIDVQIFTSSGTWTEPAGTNAVEVWVVGGGGGGGGATATDDAAGSGGGGGGMAYAYVDSGLGSTETVTVGAGGAGASGDDGNSGGNSSLGTHCVATGGGGGDKGDGSLTYSNDALGAYGGGGTTGDYIVAGGCGDPGTVLGTSFVTPGKGGVSGLGNARYSRSTNDGPHAQSLTMGSNGTSPGANDYGVGGSGGFNCDSTTARTGGDGADGIVIVKSYS